MISITQRYPYTVRSSFLTQAKHINDIFLNFGYDYRGNILKNGTSPELWANPLQISMYGRLEAMILFLLENVKSIKKQFAFAIDKDNLNIN